jgi:hypothetical protein
MGVFWMRVLVMGKINTEISTEAISTQVLHRVRKLAHQGVSKEVKKVKSGSARGIVLACRDNTRLQLALKRRDALASHSENRVERAFDEEHVQAGSVGPASAGRTADAELPQVAYSRPAMTYSYERKIGSHASAVTSAGCSGDHSLSAVDGEMRYRIDVAIDQDMARDGNSDNFWTCYEEIMVFQALVDKNVSPEKDKCMGWNDGSMDKNPFESIEKERGIDEFIHHL